jgi:hypothetical protein
MTKLIARRQPSDNLEELQGQLLRELSRLEESGPEEPELFRAYSQHAQVLAWRGVADGRMCAPQEALESLRAAQPFIERHMPDLEPAAAAATEIYIVSQSLSLAAEALAARRVEDRISDSRSETERAVLQVLADSRGTFLRRGEIYERLSEGKRPTPPRVGQILAELHEENAVLQIHGRAQGNPNAAFYALSPWGVELCRNLALIVDETETMGPKSNVDFEASQEHLETEPDQTPKPSQDAPPLLDQALSTLVDTNVPRDWRSILAGLIGNLEPNHEIRARLQYWAGRSSFDQATKDLMHTIYVGWERQGSPAPGSSNSPGSSEMLDTLIETAVKLVRTGAAVTTPLGSRSSR